jgi:hypothetical protein
MEPGFYFYYFVSKYYFFIILYMPVPQTLQVPFNAGRPFFMVTFVTLIISLFVLHLTQYPSSTILSSTK